MGSRGDERMGVGQRSRFAAGGSNASAIAHHAPCSVLLAKA